MKTDYVSYALVYSCNNFGIANYKFAWIFSRDREAIHFSVMEDMFNELENIGYDPKNLGLTKQVNCPLVYK